MPQFTCPKCRKILQVTERLAGKHVRCQYCHLIFTAQDTPKSIPTTESKRQPSAPLESLLSDREIKQVSNPPQRATEHSDSSRNEPKRVDRKNLVKAYASPRTKIQLPHHRRHSVADRIAEEDLLMGRVGFILMILGALGGILPLMGFAMRVVTHFGEHTELIACVFGLAGAILAGVAYRHFIAHCFGYGVLPFAIFFVPTAVLVVRLVDQHYTTNGARPPIAESTDSRDSSRSGTASLVNELLFSDSRVDQNDTPKTISNSSSSGQLRSIQESDLTTLDAPALGSMGPDIPSDSSGTAAGLPPANPVTGRKNRRSIYLASENYAFQDFPFHQDIHAEMEKENRSQRTQLQQALNFTGYDDFPRFYLAPWIGNDRPLTAEILGDASMRPLLGMQLLANSTNTRFANMTPVFDGATQATIMSDDGYAIGGVEVQFRGDFISSIRFQHMALIDGGTFLDQEDFYYSGWFGSGDLVTGNFTRIERIDTDGSVIFGVYLHNQDGIRGLGLLFSQEEL